VVNHDATGDFTKLESPDRRAGAVPLIQNDDFVENYL
jgi:hypothetical protein